MKSSCPSIYPRWTEHTCECVRLLYVFVVSTFVCVDLFVCVRVRIFFFIMPFLHSVRFPDIQLICNYTIAEVVLCFTGFWSTEHRYAYSKTEGNMLLSSEWTKRQRWRNANPVWNGNMENKEMNATFSHRKRTPIWFCRDPINKFSAYDSCFPFLLIHDYLFAFLSISIVCLCKCVRMRAHLRVDHTLSQHTSTPAHRRTN